VISWGRVDGQRHVLRSGGVMRFLQSHAPSRGPGQRPRSLGPEMRFGRATVGAGVLRWRRCSKAYRKRSIALVEVVPVCLAEEGKMQKAKVWHVRIKAGQPEHVTSPLVACSI
jgi:hypothetical protein